MIEEPSYGDNKMRCAIRQMPILLLVVGMTIRSTPASSELLRDDAPLDMLITSLESEDFTTRMRAVHSIGSRGPAAKDAVPALLRALEVDSMCESALAALRDIGPGATEAIPALYRALTAYPEKPATRWYAAEALAAINEPALPTLQKGLDSANMYEQIWCHAALVQIEGPTSQHLAVLAQLLSSTDKKVAQETVQALTMLGSPAKSVLPAIIQTMHRSTVRKSDLAVLLARIGHDARPAFPKLVIWLDDPEPFTRLRTAYALSKIGGDMRIAVPGLIRQLRATEDYVREQAAATLGVIGPDAEAAIPHLIVSLEDVNECVRANAATALGQIAPTSATVHRALIAAMQDESGRVRSSAAPILAEHAPVSRELIDVFIRAADDNWHNVIWACHTFFGRLNPDDYQLVPERYKNRMIR
jgi:HEAT repeat protein